MKKEKLCAAKIKLSALYKTIDGKVLDQFGFRLQEVTMDKVVNYLYTPKDSSSLAITRILFGLAMLFDIPDERGGAIMDKRWGDPNTCHFPLLPFVRAVPMPYMALVYAALWFGKDANIVTRRALGMSVGYKYRVSAITFTCCYWYLFLIEKSYWNNHSYLFGVVALLLSFTDAHCYWSIDALLNPKMKKEMVPYWNYFILKYQFFILYFMAGVKKGTAEWLTGYSVQNLSEHWVFIPFRLFLTVPQIDYLVVHWFVFAFDLTVAFWMMWGRTRHVAMLFCALFHLMNSRLFSIGMFPWVCLATMPLFYSFDWPKRVGNLVKTHYLRIKTEMCKYIHLVLQCKIIKSEKHTELNEEDIDLLKDSHDKLNMETSLSETEEISEDITKNTANKKQENKFDKKPIAEEEHKQALAGDEQKATEVEESTNAENEVNEASKEKNVKDYKILTISLIVFHIISQAFLPFSHFITQGYNNWTNGLYGYSWDMMVHTWETDSVVVRIVDNENNFEHYIDPYIYAPNERWTRHGDMLYQYAHCLKNNLMSQSKKLHKYSKNALSENISIYADVWCSMNGRFTQRMFDPKADLLTVSWSPFKPMSYLMPLLDEALSWRSVLLGIKQEVHSWHNASDVIFIADFPGYTQEKYIPTDLSNVTLTILQGLVAYEPELSRNLDGQSIKLTPGAQMKLYSGSLHKIRNIGENSAYYMYTFMNASDIVKPNKSSLKLPIYQELLHRVSNMLTFSHVVITNALRSLFQLTQCQQ